MISKAVGFFLLGVLGRYTCAFIGSALILFGSVHVVVQHLHHRPTAATAKVLLDTLVLELAETEGEEMVPASQPQVDATLPPPMPHMEMPILSDTLSDFVLPDPPPVDVPKLPDLPTFNPTLPPPKIKQTMHQLPQITLPPLEPLRPMAIPNPQASPAPAQTSQGATARVEKKTQLKTDLSKLMKRYPPEALANRWEGTVVLQLTIDAEGELEDVEVHQSSGYRVLDREAMKMMRKAEFTGGPDVILQKIEFKLQTQANVDR